MSFAHHGIRHLGSVFRFALGAGGVLGGSYLLSRLKERQSLESRLDRLELMVEKLVQPEGKKEK